MENVLLGIGVGLGLMAGLVPTFGAILLLNVLVERIFGTNHDSKADLPLKALLRRNELTEEQNKVLREMSIYLDDYLQSTKAERGATQ